MIDSAGLLSLCFLALALGAKHGFDPDHLAAIDAISRHNAARRLWLARATGTLFSLGHGSIVITVAFGAAKLHGHWHIPHWLETSGGAISVVTLLALALLNFRALRATPSGRPVHITGVRLRTLGSLLAISNPLGIALVGMLFAVSFDTVSQAALFGLSASQAGPPGGAALIAASFVAGMLGVDGANSLWMAALLRRADRRAAEATRVMAQTIATLSLVVGVLTAITLLSHTVAEWVEQQAVWLGASVVLAGAAGFAAAMIRGTLEEGPS